MRNELTQAQQKRAVELLRIIACPPYGTDEKAGNDRLFFSAFKEAQKLFDVWQEPPKTKRQRSFYGIHKPNPSN